MKAFMDNRPFWFALGLTVVISIVGLMVMVAGRALGLPQDSLVFAVVALSTAIPLAFIWWLNWWADAGFVSTAHHAPALAVPVVGMFFSLILFGATTYEAQTVRYYLVLLFLVGLSEEALSRGLLVRLFLPNGRWQAVLLPAVLFGVSHITQFLGNDMSFLENVFQMVNALIFGILYGAVRLSINCIWPLIIVHALNDFFFGVAGFGGPHPIHSQADIALPAYLILWALSIGAAIYVMRKPLTATIDGESVGLFH